MDQLNRLNQRFHFAACVRAKLSSKAGRESGLSGTAPLCSSSVSGDGPQGLSDPCLRSSHAFRVSILIASTAGEMSILVYISLGEKYT